jgi:hypothetical protein
MNWTHSIPIDEDFSSPSGSRLHQEYGYRDPLQIQLTQTESAAGIWQIKIGKLRQRLMPGFLRAKKQDE